MDAFKGHLKEKVETISRMKTSFTLSVTFQLEVSADSYVLMKLPYFLLMNVLTVTVKSVICV